MARRGRLRGRAAQAPDGARFRNIVNTTPPVEPFSADAVEAMHGAALTILRDLGIRVLGDAARAVFAAAGASVDDDHMVRMDADLVKEALASAPQEFTIRARNPARDMQVDGRTIHFAAGGGCPNVTDRVRGRRPGTLAAFRDALRLQQSFDVCALLAPAVEPQDVDVRLRHLDMALDQARLSDKVPFLYARGTAQAEDGFELLARAHGTDRATFETEPRCFTVINTNSPRQIDVPMGEGIIDFARAGQVSVITPFCLQGAMAPVALAGALTLSHAEALAGIVLAQLVRPGAPVVYGAFSSNVDLKSGAPVFGSPEHMRANHGAGQLARHIGLPWRSGAGTAANMADGQAMAQTTLALMGTVQGGANLVFHAAGWLEGGLTFGFEKFIADLDVLHALALSMTPDSGTQVELGLEDIAAVPPGGHFFDAPGTMERYATAFHEPLLFSSDNFGQWEENGCRTAEERATTVWQGILADFEAPPIADDRLEAMEAFVERRRAEGGAAISE